MLRDFAPVLSGNQGTGKWGGVVAQANGYGKTLVKENLFKWVNFLSI